MSAIQPTPRMTDSTSGGQGPASLKFQALSVQSYQLDSPPFTGTAGSPNSNPLAEAGRQLYDHRSRNESSGQYSDSDSLSGREDNGDSEEHGASQHRMTESTSSLRYQRSHAGNAGSQRDGDVPSWALDREHDRIVRVSQSSTASSPSSRRQSPSKRSAPIASSSRSSPEASHHPNPNPISQSYGSSASLDTIRGVLDANTKIRDDATAVLSPHKASLAHAQVPTSQSGESRTAEGSSALSRSGESPSPTSGRPAFTQLVGPAEQDALEDAASTSNSVSVDEEVDGGAWDVDGWTEGGDKDGDETAGARRGSVRNVPKQGQSKSEYAFPRHRLPTRMRDESKIPLVIVACGSFSPPTYLHLRIFEMAKDQIIESGKYELLGGYYSPVSDYYKKEGLAKATHRVRMCELAVEKTSTWLMVDAWESLQDAYQRTAVVLDHFDEEINGAVSRGRRAPRSSPYIRSPAGPNASAFGSHSRHNSSTAHTQAHANGTQGAGLQAAEEKEEEDDAAPSSSSLASNGNVPGDSHPAAANEGGGVLLSDGSRRRVKIMLLAGGDLIQSMGEPGVWDSADLHHILGRYGCLIVERTGADVWSFLLSHDLLWRYRRNLKIVKQTIYNDISSSKVRLFVRRGHSIKYLLPNSVINYIEAQKLYRLPVDAEEDFNPDDLENW